MRWIEIMILNFVFLLSSSVYSQSFIDSISKITDNILIYKRECQGCVVLKNNSKQSFNDKVNIDTYIFWKLKNKIYVRKHNKRDTSKVYTLKRFRGNIFKFICKNKVELDTTKLMAPLSYNKKDSIWFPSEYNHYYRHSFIFPNSKTIEDTIVIKSYQFHKIKDETKKDTVLLNLNPEFKKNITIYEHNNNTPIYKLLCMIENKIRKISNK